MPKIIIDDAKGLYQTSGKGVVGLTQSKTVNTAWTSGTTISSGAITIPAKSLITAIHLVSTTIFTAAAGRSSSVKVGTSTNDDEFVVSTEWAANLGATAAGKGISTNTEISTALSNGNPIEIIAGTSYVAAETDVYIVSTSNGALTGGALQFTVEFITFE
jgi:hypothetical protein